MNKRIFLVCLFVVLLVFLSGCEAIEPGSISGMVVDGITGEPLAGVSVSCRIPIEAMNYESFEDYIYPQTVTSENFSELSLKYVMEIERKSRTSTTTAVDGTFRLDNVVSVYSVSLSFLKVPYKRKDVEVIIRPKEAMDFGVIKIYLGEALADLTVFVVDEGNKGIEDAKVFLTKTDEFYPNSPKTETAQRDDETGEQGAANRKVFFANTIEFQTNELGADIRLVEPGVYRVRAEKNGYKTEIIEGVVVDKDLEIIVTLRK